MFNIENNKKVYDVVLYFETKLQETIVARIVKEKYEDCNVLILYRDKNYLYIGNNRFFFNFHFRSKSMVSYLLLFRVIPVLRNIQTRDFIAAFFPGINARILSKYINHERLCCIEDGIGTLQNIFFPETIISSISLKPINWMYKHGLRQGVDELNKIKIYYSIYGNITSEYIKGKILSIEYFNKEYPKLTDEVIFIGQPLVMKNMISLQEYNVTINSIANQSRKIIYVYHPIETTVYNFSDKVELYKLNIGFEEYFNNLKLKPQTVYSYFSTALINIKLKYPEINCYYLNSDIVSDNIKYILENFGILKFDLMRLEI